jgi:transposase
MKRTKRYSPDVTDSQWQVIKYLFYYKRKRKNDLRQIVNAVFYLVKTGCPWREIPGDLLAWQTVRYYFDRWRTLGLIDRLQRRLRGMVRRKAGRKISPSAAIAEVTVVEGIRYPANSQ